MHSDTNNKKRYKHREKKPKIRLRRERNQAPFWNGILAKVILVYIILLIPMYVLLMISVRSYMNSLQDQAVKAEEAILKLNMNNLDAEMKRIDQFIYYLQERNTDYQRLCNWEDTSMDYVSLYSVNNQLINQVNASQYAESLFIYIEKPDKMLMVFSDFEADAKVTLKDELIIEQLNNRNVRWDVKEINEKQYLVHTIGYFGVYVGIIIDMESYINTIKEQTGYHRIQVILNNKPDPEASDHYKTVTKEISQLGQYIHVALEKDEINRALPKISKVTYDIAISFVLIFPALFLTFWHIIVRPLKRIERGICKLGEGDQEYRIPDFKSSNEFISMKESFNSMAEEIQSLKIKTYEEKLEKEQMALQNLLLQIRPHFMLNSFNQIFSMAQLKDYEGIQRMSMYLSKFFRYLFRSNRIATIRSEFDVVENYLEMMRLRYMDCFEIEWNIDEALLNYRIPPLLLHNFVENIFKYAVCEGSEVTITISLQKEDDRVVICIADDGPGMEPEILKKIEAMEPIDKKDGTHIGIYNSAYRLKTLCGEQCQLMVQSVLTEGTTVKIILPYTGEKV